ncbi:MAG: hypothetical protein WCP11_02920 [Candidatus Saccharibacteria bacterium]
MNKKLKPINKKDPKLNEKSLTTKISLVINYILISVIVVIIAANFFHVFDYAIVNRGIDVMCSSNFRDNAYNNLKDATERKRAVASIDYFCAQNGAETYYNDGVNKYLESVGLPKAE